MLALHCWRQIRGSIPWHTTTSEPVSSGTYNTHMQLNNLLFMDCETTGLDPKLDEVWSVAVIAYDHNCDQHMAEWSIEISEFALDRLKSIPPEFYATYETSFDPLNAVMPNAFAAQFMDFVNALHLDRPHLVGAVPSFDDRRVGDLLGSKPWHYHLVCVENLIAGTHGIQPPWNSEELSRAVGVDPLNYQRHTAMGDVLWARDMYKAAMLDRVRPEPVNA